VAAVPAQARAQNDPSLPEIPLTQRTPVSARFAGMGGASLAIADDHSATLANPATLGLVRGIEFSAGFQKQSGEQEVDYLGNPSTVDFGKTRLSHLGFAYPFPTYRGRFVVGFQYGRVSSLDSDFLLRDPAGDLRQSIYEEGAMSAYAVAAAIQVSPYVTIGAAGSVLGGSSFREVRTTVSGQGGSDSYTSTDVDISGITGSLGALVEVAPPVRLGFLIQLPEDLDLEGSSLVDDDQGTDDFEILDEIRLPYRLGAGLGVALPNTVLGLDVIYADWSEIRYFGPLRTADGQSAYRETVELRVGAEYLLALPTPIRLRAGFLLQPIAYQLLLTDGNDYESADFDSDRKYVTVGAGALLGRAFTLDLAYMHGGYERSAIQHTMPVRYREEVSDRRFLASVSLRLN
jgi:long-subunit fatty acid transport protein